MFLIDILIFVAGLLLLIGIKGAVPIILATFPLMRGLPEGALLFNVVFFVVLVSAILQGWTMPFIARRLGLLEPPVAEPPVTREISAIKDVNADIVEYTLDPRSPAAGRRLSALGLPDGVVVAMLARDQALISPRGNTMLQTGGHTVVVLRDEARAEVDQVFSRPPAVAAGAEA